MTKTEIEDLIFQIECDITTLTFVILKLTEVIDWAWFWVLFPLWTLFITKALINKQKGKNK